MSTAKSGGKGSRKHGRNKVKCQKQFAITASNKAVRIAKNVLRAKDPLKTLAKMSVSAEVSAYVKNPDKIAARSERRNAAAVRAARQQ